MISGHIQQAGNSNFNINNSKLDQNALVLWHEQPTVSGAFIISTIQITSQ